MSRDVEIAPGADARSVRQWNERRVLEILRTGESFRVSELAQATGLTTAGLRHVLRTLLEKHWVEEREVTQGGKGRPAQTYRMPSLAGRVLGVDIGGHTVRAELQTDAGVFRSEVPIEPSESMVAATRAAVREALAGVDTSQVWTTGLALSGIVSDDGRIVRSIALPHFEGLRPCELLADVLPGHVHSWHDTRAALWAEHSDGVARDDENVLLLQLGRRPSMALLLDGRLHSGVHGSAGEFSFSELLPREFEWATGGGDPDVQGSSLRAALAGDPTAVAGARSLFLGLAPQIAFATALVDPSVLVIGGSLSPVVAPVIPEFYGKLGAQLETVPRVVASSHDQFAAAHGARHLSLRALWGALTDSDEGVRPLQRESVS